MELIINIGDNNKDDIYFEKKQIIVSSSNGRNIFDIINNQKAREDCIDDLREEISYNPQDENHNLKLISKIEQMGDLSIENFAKVIIRFQSDFNPIEISDLLESIIVPLDLDLSYLTNNNIIAFKKIKFKTDPKAVTRYDQREKSSLKDIISSTEIIDNIKIYVARYDLSPLEQLMLIYDLIKERENQNDYPDKISSGRDLNKVLSGDDIVCEGYANIFSAVANALGIPTIVKTYFLETKDHGHADNVSFISDDKYNFHGPLEFDPTWDSKRNKSDVQYIDNYYWFGYTIKYAEFLKKNQQLKPRNNFNLEHSYQRYQSLLSKGAPIFTYPEFGLKMLISKFKDYFNKIEDPRGLALLQEFETEDVFEEDKKQRIEELYEQYNRTESSSLDYETFIKILYQTRRIEHYINPEKYALSIDDVSRIAKSRFIRQQFMELLLNKPKKVSDILLENENLNNIDNNIEDKVSYDAKRLELLHHLRKELENKTENDLKNWHI